MITYIAQHFRKKYCTEDSCFKSQFLRTKLNLKTLVVHQALPCQPNHSGGETDAWFQAANRTKVTQPAPWQEHGLPTLLLQQNCRLSDRAKLSVAPWEGHCCIQGSWREIIPSPARKGSAQENTTPSCAAERSSAGVSVTETSHRSGVSLCCPLCQILNAAPQVAKVLSHNYYP